METTVGNFSMGDSSGNVSIGDDNTLSQESALPEPVVDLAAAEAEVRSAPIFISHCHDDAEIVELFITLMKTGLNLTNKDIFATGQPGTTIPQGDMWLDTLKKRLQETQLIIAIITPAYLSSDFCMVELGALWVEETPRIPLMVKPADFGNVGSILGNMQLSPIDDKEALNAMRDRVVASKEVATDTTQWERRRDVFLTEMSYVKAAPSRRVSEAKHEALVAELEALKAKV